MRSKTNCYIPPANLSTDTLRDLCDSAHRQYARCSDDVAPQLAAAIVDLELALIGREWEVVAPEETMVPLNRLPEAMRCSTALTRLRKAARRRDERLFLGSLYFLDDGGHNEAWGLAYAFRDDDGALAHVLQNIFLAALSRRDSFDAAYDVFEEIIKGKPHTEALRALERALLKLLCRPAPHHALIASTDRWQRLLDDE